MKYWKYMDWSDWCAQDTEKYNPQILLGKNNNSKDSLKTMIAKNIIASTDENMPSKCDSASGAEQLHVHKEQQKGCIVRADCCY